MKILSGNGRAWLMAITLGTLSASGRAFADDSTNATTSVQTTPLAPVASVDPASAPTTVTATTTAPALSYGVPEVLQLSQAQVPDSTILAFIQNSGNSYGLNADQIIYLQQQGVSQAVINAMVTQPRPGTAVASYATPSPDNSQTTGPMLPPQPAPAPVDPTPAPEPAPSVAPDAAPQSTVSVYVIPAPVCGNYAGDYYCAPAASCASSVVVIGGGGWVGYRGGYHRTGGWHR